MRKILIATVILLVLLSPAAAFAQEENDEGPQAISVEVPGYRLGWINSNIWLNEGDIFTITVNGTIDIWPNCEETKAEAGYPDLDCVVVQQVGPNGVTVFGPALPSYPYPGGPNAALIGRVGNAPSFLVGTGGTFTAPADGMLQFANNDIEYMEDNYGSFIVFVSLPYPIVVPPDNGVWYDTGIVLKKGDIFTITASGTINIWPNCEETKVEKGYPDLDCRLVQFLGPNGTPVFGPAEPGCPLPGANIGVLVARINGSPPFLVGAGGTFVAEFDGPLFVAVNDTEYWAQDDLGFFNVVISVVTEGDSVEIPGDADEWTESGWMLKGGKGVTLSASGIIDLWPDCESEKDDKGMPDIDCELMHTGPEGTLGFELASEDYPLPGARVGALIGRFGDDGTPFLIGNGGTFTPDVDAEFQFRINDVFDMEDNVGSFVVVME